MRDDLCRDLLNSMHINITIKTRLVQNLRLFLSLASAFTTIMENSQKF